MDGCDETMGGDWSAKSLISEEIQRSKKQERDQSIFHGLGTGIVWSATT